MTPAQRREIAEYLETGDHDIYASAWPGNVIDREVRQDEALRSALIRMVERRAAGRVPPAKLPETDLMSFTRQRIEPMVRGLFPTAEQEVVLALLERSVVFLSPESIAQVLRDGCPWLGTTWSLANLYLHSMGAEVLAADEQIVGLSSDLKCYVSIEYFKPRSGDVPRFDDYLVHEAAHVLHDAKRGRIGLKETRHRERLVDLEFRMRETFAYACEAFRLVVQKARRPADRIALVEAHLRENVPCEKWVDRSEYVDILREAATARNGWRRILARCSPPRAPARRLDGATSMASGGSRTITGEPDAEAKT